MNVVVSVVRFLEHRVFVILVLFFVRSFCCFVCIFGF